MSPCKRQCSAVAQRGVQRWHHRDDVVSCTTRRRSSIYIQPLCVAHCLTAGSNLHFFQPLTIPSVQPLPHQTHASQRPAVRGHIGWTLWFHRPAELRFWLDLLDVSLRSTSNGWTFTRRTSSRCAFNMRHRLDDIRSYRPADAACATHIGWTMTKKQ
jgi:hypothetical protein